MSLTFHEAVQRQGRRAAGIAIGVGALLGGWTTLLICIISYDITAPRLLPTLVLATVGTVGLIAAIGLALLFLRAMRGRNARLRQEVAAALQTGYLPADANAHRWVAILRTRAEPRRLAHLAPFGVLCIVLPITLALGHHENPYATLFWSTYLIVALAVIIATTVSIHRTRLTAQALLTQLEASTR